MPGCCTSARAETLCGSGLGIFAQALNHQDATYCAQDNDFHSASIVVLLIGLTLVGTGVVRMIMASAAHAASSRRTGISGVALLKPLNSAASLLLIAFLTAGCGADGPARATRGLSR